MASGCRLYHVLIVMCDLRMLGNVCLWAAVSVSVVLKTLVIIQCVQENLKFRHPMTKDIENVI